MSGYGRRASAADATKRSAGLHPRQRAWQTPPSLSRPTRRPGSRTSGGMSGSRGVACPICPPPCMVYVRYDPPVFGGGRLRRWEGVRASPCGRLRIRENPERWKVWGRRGQNRPGGPVPAKTDTRTWRKPLTPRLRLRPVVPLSTGRARCRPDKCLLAGLSIHDVAAETPRRLARPSGTGGDSPSKPCMSASASAASAIPPAP